MEIHDDILVPVLKGPSNPADSPMTGPGHDVALLRMVHARGDQDPKILLTFHRRDRLITHKVCKP